MDEDHSGNGDTGASPELIARSSKTQDRDKGRGPKDKTSTSHDEHRKSLRRSWRAASPITKLELVFAGIIATATVLYSMFAGWTLYEIRSSSADTHALAEAASKQAIHTQAIATAADKISGAADKFSSSAESINKETKEAVGNFGRMAKASEGNIAAVQEASRLDQRAWVNVGLSMPTIADVTKPVETTIEVFNSGKTFALKVNFLSSLGVSKEPPNGVDYYSVLSSLKSNRTSVCVISPGREYPVKLEVAEGGLRTLDKAVTKDWYVYVWGDIEYYDVFSKTVIHRTHFCAMRRISEDRKDLDQCGFHNDAD
jgi:hypothetical protein